MSGPQADLVSDLSSEKPGSDVGFLCRSERHETSRSDLNHCTRRYVSICKCVCVFVCSMLHPAKNWLGCNSSSYRSSIINLPWLEGERSGPVSMTQGWIRSREGPFSCIDHPSCLAVQEITAFPSRQHGWYITHVELYVKKDLFTLHTSLIWVSDLIFRTDCPHF